MNRAAIEQQLAAAKQHQKHYADRAAEVKALAAEQPSDTGRVATMGTAMRLQGQALVWQREVLRLTAELQAAHDAPALLKLSAEQCADQDDTHNFQAEAA